MRRDGYIILAILIGLVGLMVATDPGGGPALRWSGGAVAAATFALTVYLIAIPEVLRTILRRAMLVLLPVFVAVATIIVVLVRLEGLEDGARNAIIAGTIVMSGWVVTFLTHELRLATERERRRADLIEALSAEAKKIRKDAGKLDAEAAIGTIRTNFESDPNYQPFVFYGHNFETFKKVMSEIEVLPFDQIETVVNFYQLMDRLERMETVLGSEAFSKLPSMRKEDGLVRFMRLHGQVASEAEKVISLSASGAKGTRQRASWHGA